MVSLDSRHENDVTTHAECMPHSVSLSGLQVASWICLMQHSEKCCASAAGIEIPEISTTSDLFRSWIFIHLL